MKTKRLPTTYGIEFSFVPAFDRDNDLINKVYHQYGADSPQLIEVRKSQIEEAYEAVYKVRGQGINAHADGGCLEIPSPVFRTVNQSLKFWDKIKPRAAKECYIPRRIDKTPKQNIYYGTGGGHIHLGLFEHHRKWAGYPRNTWVEKGKVTRYQVLMIKNLLTFVTNNPWMGWVFNEFMDDINARALAMSTNILQEIKRPVPRKLKKHKNCRTNCKYCSRPDKYVESYYNYLSDMITIVSKDDALNFKSHGQENDFVTAEFRFFDAPRSKYQIEEHVMFAMGIYKHCKEMARKGKEIKLKVKSKKDLEHFKNEKTVRKEFQKTVRKFGLDWKRYEKYIKNYIDRDEHGRLV